MRIALLSYEYPPETGFGGIGTYTYYHARALAKLGHRVHVFAGSTQNGTFHHEHDGVVVTRMKREGWLNRLLEPARSRQYYWFQNRVETAYTQWLSLRQALSHTTFDIVEAPECGADASLISALLDVPVAVRFHSPARLIMDSYPVPAMDRRLTARVEQMAINRARVRTSCSAFLASEVQRRMGVPAPIHVIPNGIDLELFDQSSGAGEARKRLGIPDDALMILFANRLEERKGIHLIPDIAIPIMTRHPDVHLVLAGRDLFGYGETGVLPRLREHGLHERLHLLGGVDLQTVRELLRAADIFLLPSLWENCPYSCIEAMAAACAIVASDCGGMPELIRCGSTGLLAHSESPRSYVERLEELIDTPHRRLELGQAARRFVEEHLTDTTIAARLVRAYQAG